VEQGSSSKIQTGVDPSWKEQWKFFFEHRKLESSSG
jgi:hypothetical protein